MKLAVMQPYIFPYAGYFQLINSVDKFVFYDDVSFMKQSWINRNRILFNGEIYTFSIPVEDISSFRPINETRISYKKDWEKKLLKTFEQAYKKAAHFGTVYEMLKETFSHNFEFISELAKQSVMRVKEYLGIPSEIVSTSAGYGNNKLKGHERVIDICRKENADIYINAPGGTELYSRDDFKNKNIELRFIKPGEIVYRQFSTDVFIPNLSIIDVLMFNSKPEIKSMLNNYDLI